MIAELLNLKDKVYWQPAERGDEFRPGQEIYQAMGLHGGCPRNHSHRQHWVVEEEDIGIVIFEVRTK
jgi:hypothetical protein